MSADWKELWKRRQASRALATGGPARDGIQSHIESHKRQKLETKASHVAVPAACLQPKVTDAQAKELQIRANLAKVGFFDDDAAASAAPPKETMSSAVCTPINKGQQVTVADTNLSNAAGCIQTHVTATVPASNASPASSASWSAGENSATAEGDVTSELPAGHIFKASPRAPAAVDAKGKKAAALPEGFYDDQRKDAKARNAAQEFNQRMHQELEKLQHELSQEAEVQYEKDQQSARTWNMSREMDECMNMAQAHERLESVRLRLEQYRAHGAQPHGTVGLCGVDATAHSDSDSGSDTAEDGLDIYGWRMKGVRRVAQHAKRQEAIEEKEGSGSEGEMDASPP